MGNLESVWGKPWGLAEGSRGGDGGLKAPGPHSRPHESLPPPGANSPLASTCGKGVHWGRRCPVLRFLLRGRGASLQVWGRVIVFRGGGSSLGGGRDASDCRIPPPFPLDLGNERGGVRAAAGWVRGTDLIQNRLGSDCKARGGNRRWDSCPIPSAYWSPLRGGAAWWGLFGWGWRWEPSLGRPKAGEERTCLWASRYRPWGGSSTSGKA